MIDKRSTGGGVPDALFPDQLPSTLEALAAISALVHTWSSPHFQYALARRIEPDPDLPMRADRSTQVGDEMMRELIADWGESDRATWIRLSHRLSRNAAHYAARLVRSAGRPDRSGSDLAP